MTDWLQHDGAMAERIRTHDWASTPLGPLTEWPDVLKTSVALMLDSHFPQCIVWGACLITLYNDGFVPILGSKPEALGRAFSDIWKEAWPDISPIADLAFAGKATYIENFPVVIHRSQRPELAYFTFCYSPIRDSAGKVVGMLDTVTETTTTVYMTQRLSVLDAISHAVVNAHDPQEILAITMSTLADALRVTHCAYADMEADEDTFFIRDNWLADGATRLVGQYSLSEFGQHAVSRLKAGKPLVINDAQAELPAHAAASFTALGVKATLCLPLIKGGRLTALMAIHDTSPRLWSPQDVALLREVTERSWAHIERARADAAVRAGLAELAQLNTTLEKRVQERSARLLHIEAALHQSQKLEAIGQLTGGVAHDFNNLLTIIRSSVDFLRMPNLSDVRRERYVNAVSDTVERASKLTGQLLAFARRQPLNPQVFEIGQRIRDIGDMLETITGARINVVVQLPPETCYVRADASQFETALINMALNARDAMEGQGTLLLRLNDTTTLPAIRGHAGCDEPFVAISLTDTGIGISSRMLTQIFEPFFTTKEVGKGTGLGLSQVFGFAKQSGGNVDVASVLGQGSVFTLYLPRASAQALMDDASGVCAPACLDPEADKPRVLLVEDNLEVGRFAQQIMQDLGYETAWATHAEEALHMIGPQAMAFDAVFSDVVMPGMTGVVMAREMRRRRPDLPIILASGYSEELAFDGYDGFEFLPKPYSIEQISQILEKITHKR
ncbi:GAF domain-containing protein [Pseudomonas lundensis]|uniref:GAF domain-containing protein n=1 Tax=Pseudomonas lundensis TaxID=86185 RepID=UPI0006423AA3|nr:GAF domain-containing protein [Pseudomonas lundensis]